MTEQNRQGITSDIPSDKDRRAQHVKEIAAQLNFGAVQPKEDKPKIRNRCGSCIAFHTPFCSFAYTDEPDLTTSPSDYACSRFYPKLTRPRRMSFSEKVEKL
jgi:hypothetical protein